VDPSAERICRFGLGQGREKDRTSVDRDTGELHYQCLDGLINNFNATMLLVLRCNMDIKFIGSGSAALAILYYVSDYISKTQLKTHIAYSLLEHALKKMIIYDSDMSADSVFMRARRVLLKCANAIISKQELSAQQVSAYLLGFGDHYCSHRFQELYWRSYEQYLNELQPLDGADEQALSADLDPVPDVGDPAVDVPTSLAAETLTAPCTDPSGVISVEAARGTLKP
jgi:hypothetical protein